MNIFVFALVLAMVAVPLQAMADDGAFVGLQVQGISPAVGDALGMPGAGGVLVRDVALHGPAAMAGIRRGDLIVRIGNIPIATFDDLVKTVQGLKISAEVAVHVRRGSETAILTLRPGPWPDGPGAAVGLRHGGSARRIRTPAHSDSLGRRIPFS